MSDTPAPPSVDVRACQAAEALRGARGRLIAAGIARSRGQPVRDDVLTLEMAAERHGVTANQARIARNIQVRSPSLFGRVRAGELSLGQAHHQVFPRKPAAGPGTPGDLPG
jgi:hypothetical protein